MRCICRLRAGAHHPFGGEEGGHIDTFLGCRWKERLARVSLFGRKNIHERWGWLIHKNKLFLRESIVINRVFVFFALQQLYISWIDTTTLNETTYKRYGSVYPWPLNHIQCWRKRRSVLNKLKIFGWANYTNDQVLKKVEKCCVTLSEKLGKNQYFYGDRFVIDLCAQHNCQIHFITIIHHRLITVPLNWMR